jgi:hypothetical protein
MYKITTKLAGVTFNQCQENIKLYGPPSFSTFELTREPDNPYDSNAIWVGIGFYKFGYIPKHQAVALSAKMDKGMAFIAESAIVNRSAYHNTVGMTVTIKEIQ